MKQIILLNPDLPESLQDLLSDHLRRTESQVFLLAETVTEKGYFLEVDIFPTQHTEDENMVWRVQIPIQCVLAIAQFRPDAKRPFGFV